MFVIDENPTFTHTVKVQVPVNGGHREETFKATFRVLPLEEVEKLDLEKTGPSTEFMREILVTVDGLFNTEKEAVAYSDQVRDQLLRWPHIRRALIDTYLAAISKAKAGN
jgi:hypothetical protein